jgi:hypothetical protein
MAGRRTQTDPAAGAAELLYGSSLASFTAERRRLSEELGREGEAEAAKHVARLAKPSVSAWAVNRLHRDAREDLDALFAAGSRMRSGDLAATREQRAVLARLHRRAEEILTQGGHAASPAMLRRVTTTLQALSAAGTFDPDPPGQLVQDRDPPGFDLLAGVPAPRPATKATTKAKATKAAKKDERAAAPVSARVDPEERRREQAARAQRKLMERTAEQARRKVAAREKEADEIRAELERAEAKAERLRSTLGRAEKALEEARAAADAAARALGKG